MAPKTKIALRKALISIFFAPFFENKNIWATPLVSQLTENCKLHPTDPNSRLQEGTVGKSLNLGKSYQLLCGPTLSGPETLLVQKLVIKKVWIIKCLIIFWPKNLISKKCFVQKKCLLHIFWFKNIFGPKKCSVKKIPQSGNMQHPLCGTTIIFFL